jgi:hypothetical protein
LAIPLALIVTHSVVWYYYAVPLLPPFALWFVYAIYGVLFTLFAVTCHRLVLLDAESVARRWQPRWSWRETRFLMWIVLLWGTCLAAMMIILTIVLNLWMAIAGTHPEWFTEWGMHVIKIPALYVFARLCVLFPATALDRNASLRWAWELTRNNGWRLMVVVGFLPWLFSNLVYLLYRDDATRVEWVVLTGVAVALFAVEIAAVSISYRELNAHAQSTTATT